MPEIVNGITVPVDGDPINLPGDLKTFAEDIGTAAQEAGAAAAVGYASSLDDAKVSALLDDQGTETASALSASIGAVGGGLFMPQGYGARALASKCAIGVNAAVGIAGDSTADKPYEYLQMGLAAFIKQFPRQSADRYEWDGTSAYGTPQPILTGITARTVVMRDEFDRSAADLVGSTPNVGVVWFAIGNGAGDWELNGSACVATADATSGSVFTTVVAGDGELVANLTLAANDAPRFVVKRVNDSNRIRIDVQRNSSGQYRLQLWKFIGGVQTAIATSEYFFHNTAVTTFDVTCRVVGTRVTGSVNGQYIGGTLSTDDVTALSTGTGVGLEGANRGAAIINRMEWATVTAATSSGAVAIYNGSKSGSILSYQEGVISTLFPSGTLLDVAIVNSGHNYGSGSASSYLVAIDSFIETLRTVQPDCGVVIASQNPEVSPAPNVAAHAARNAALPGYAAVRGYGYIPSCETFATMLSIGPAYMQSDGVHPTGGSEGGAGVQSAAVITYLNRLAGLAA
ncbi:hypothetical protein [Nocardioides soli]|uniref:Uncharacterized protein n=1 Tax=Nocardioides soli TaxID=1036020 RepID=A0A7W4VT53_9ACTN|nr:hypothetical protein [Nocardioides soli]MBB3041038.1 hypothetical protein [Nocardioides soli]